MSERNSKLELLGSAPIPKALMALGVPIMIGMLINALYNLVDAESHQSFGDRRTAQKLKFVVAFIHC